MRTKGFRDALAERGITIEEAATESGVKVGHVRKIYDGDCCGVPVGAAVELRDALFPGMSLDSLFNCKG